MINRRGSLLNGFSQMLVQLRSGRKVSSRRIKRVRSNDCGDARAESLETRALLSALTISTDVTGAGAILREAPDEATTGDDLTVLDAVVISSSANSVTLNAGDDLIFQGTPSVSALTTITLNIDSGDADAGVGATATLNGTFMAPGGVAVNGGPDNDAFVIAAASIFDSAFTVDGAGGTDSLELNSQGFQLLF